MSNATEPREILAEAAKSLIRAAEVLHLMAGTARAAPNDESKRLRWAEKKRKQRQKQRETQGDKTGDNGGTSEERGGERGGVGCLEKSLLESGNDEKQQAKSNHQPVRAKPVPPVPPMSPLNVPLPERLDVQEFRKVWADWETDRKQRRRALTPGAKRMQLGRLEKYPVVEAVRIVNQSIENGWIKLVYPEEQSNGTRKPVSDHRATKSAREYDESELYASLDRPARAEPRSGGKGAGSPPGTSGG